jgi:hypothetical protein
LEPGQHPQHAALERELLKIGSYISECETAGGQPESGFVKAVARTAVSGKHLAQHRAEGRHVFARVGGARTPVGWKKNRAALLHAYGDRRNLSVRHAAAVEVAKHLGHVSGVFQDGSEWKWSLSHSIGQRATARTALTGWPSLRHLMSYTADARGHTSCHCT